MNEWKSIIMLYKTPIHVLVCKIWRKTYVLLSRFPLLKLMVKITSIFGSYRFVGIAWHFLTFTSPSSKLEVVHPPCCGVEEQMLIFSSKFNALTSQRLLNWNPWSNPQVNHRQPSPACLKFGKTSNRAVENLPQRNSESRQRMMHALNHRISSCF